MSLVAFPCNFHPNFFLTFHSFVNWVVISFRSLPCSPQTPKHGPGLRAWWCNNHLEKWWSSSIGRMTSHIWNGKLKNHVPNLSKPVICLMAYVPYVPLNQSTKRTWSQLGELSCYKAAGRTSTPGSTFPSYNNLLYIYIHTYNYIYIYTSIIMYI